MGRAGSRSEAGGDTGSSGYAEHYSLGLDGNWQALSGSGSYSDAASWNSSYSGSGTYGNAMSGGSVSGTWSNSGSNGGSTATNTTSTLGSNGNWVTTGTYNESGAASWKSSYSGSGTYTADTGSSASS